MVNEEFIEAVKNRQFYHFGNVVDVSNYDWYKFVKLVATHPTNREKGFSRDWRDEKQRVELVGAGFRTKIPDFAKDIMADLKQTFYKNIPTIVCFAGFTENHESLEIHKDVMDVLYVQVLGEVDWSIWEPDPDITDSRIQPHQGKKIWTKHFTPGDMIWVPRGMYHHVAPRGPRVGFSFGVEDGADPADYL